MDCSAGFGPFLSIAGVPLKYSRAESARRLIASRAFTFNRLRGATVPKIQRRHDEEVQ